MQQPAPPEFLEVDSISRSDANGKPSFNGGRPYVISINEKLPEARAARGRLVARLHDSEQLDRFVFEWFGTAPPTRLNLGIGRDVPVKAAQAVIAAYAVELRGAGGPSLPDMDDDEGFGNTQRVYVQGGLEDRGEVAMKAEEIKALLNPLLTRR